MSGSAAGADMPYAADGRGLRLVVRVTPRAGRAAIGGVVRDAQGRPSLAVRLAAPPVDGAANAALVKVLAAALGLRRADVTILSGATGRQKMLHLDGEAGALAARLDALIRDPA